MLFQEVFIRYGILYLLIFSGGRFVSEVVLANQSTDIGYVMMILTLAQALMGVLLVGHFVLSLVGR